MFFNYLLEPAFHWQKVKLPLSLFLIQSLWGEYETNWEIEWFVRTVCEVSSCNLGMLSLYIDPSPPPPTARVVCTTAIADIYRWRRYHNVFILHLKILNSNCSLIPCSSVRSHWVRRWIKMLLLDTFSKSSLSKRVFLRMKGLFDWAYMCIVAMDTPILDGMYLWGIGVILFNQRKILCLHKFRRNGDFHWKYLLTLSSLSSQLHRNDEIECYLWNKWEQ